MDFVDSDSDRKKQELIEFIQEHEHDFYSKHLLFLLYQIKNIFVALSERQQPDRYL